MKKKPPAAKLTVGHFTFTMYEYEGGKQVHLSVATEAKGRVFTAFCRNGGVEPMKGWPRASKKAAVAAR